MRSKYRVFVKTLGYKRRKWDGSQGSSEEFSCISITKEKQPMGSRDCTRCSQTSEEARMLRGQRGWICPGKGYSLCEKRGFLGNQQKSRQEPAILKDSGYIQIEVTAGFFSTEYRTRIWMSKKRQAYGYKSFWSS